MFRLKVRLSVRALFDRLFFLEDVLVDLVDVSLMSFDFRSTVLSRSTRRLSHGHTRHPRCDPPAVTTGASPTL